MPKLLLFIILIFLNSCSSDSKVKTEISNSLNKKQKDSFILKPFVEYDSLDRLLGEGFLNDKGLFEGKLTIYTHSLGAIEKLNMHNDSIIGYVSEYDTNGTLKCYKNYKSTSIWEKGDVNELLAFDSSGVNYHKRAFYIDISNCLTDSLLMKDSIIKVLPKTTLSLKLQKLNSDSNMFDCIKVEEGEFKVDFDKANIHYGDSVLFSIYFEDVNSKGEKVAHTIKINKVMKKFEYFTPKLK